MAAPTAGAMPSGVKVVLLDIEGTVCPISFVKDVLFPYALSALPGTLDAEWDDPAFAHYRGAFPSDCKDDRPAFEAHVRDLVARDVKAPYLKALQGYLWENGYRSGELKAPLFPDVAPRIVAWTSSSKAAQDADGKLVMIYSSGSVPAQKLLFEHTNYTPQSNLLPRITDYFDTVNAGPKTEAASYTRIAAQHAHVPPEQWLFLSDNVLEVEAAKAAGMHSFVVQRPGNNPLPEGTTKKHRVIETLDEL